MRPKLTLIIAILFICFGASLPTANAITGGQKKHTEITQVAQEVDMNNAKKAVSKRTTHKQKRLGRKMDRFYKRIGSAGFSISTLTLVGIITLVVGLIMIGAAGGIVGLIVGIVGLALALVGLVLLILGLFLDMDV